MATILRSLKFVRNLNIGPGGRRLGSTALQRLNNIQPLRAQPLASHNSQERNYVTNVAAQQNYNHQGNVDLIINNVDRKVRTFGNIDRSDVEEILDAVVESGFITSTQALLLIRCCGEFLSSENLKMREVIVKKVWDTVIALGVQLDVSHYNSLLLVNLDNETDFSPLDILVEMKEKNIEPNRVTYQRLIDQYCNKGDIAGATKILEHMSAHDIPLNEVIFNSLIKGHSEAGDLESAVKMLDIMKQAGIEPISRSYTAVLCAHAKRGNIDAIRSTLQECKEKDILLENKEILEIIYTLALNKHSQHVDEIMSLLTEGSMYNKQTIPFIHRLIEKDCIDTAFKLLKSLFPPRTFKPLENNQADSGRFFIKKLVTSNTKPEIIVKYCKLMQEENLNSNSFILALHTAFINDKHHLALPLLKASKESNIEVREHYFFPLFVSFSKVNNLQGILNTLKSMIFDFNISPSLFTLRDYVIPFMVESHMNNCKILEENNLPFSLVANATILHLLRENKTQQAAKFITLSSMKFKLKVLIPHLINATRNTKDVKSLIVILHHQYIHNFEKDKDNDESIDEQMTSKQFVNNTLVKVIDQLTDDKECIINIIKALTEKGINIDKQTAEKMKEQLGQNLTSEISDLINVLVSENLNLAPLSYSQTEKRKFSNDKLISNLESLEEKSQTCTESKMLLLQTYIKLKNDEKAVKILEELEKENPTYTIGCCASLLQYYSRLENIEDAEKWYKKMYEINPEFKMHKSKILIYADLLVNNNRIDDALKVLNCPVIDVNEDKIVLSNRFLTSVRKNFPNRIDECFNVLQDKKFFLKATSLLLGNLVRVPFELGDTATAIEKFKWCCEKYELTPQRNVLMQKLINDEDAKSLQYITDLCTKVHGEMNALFDLAIAFFECNRPRQARKILETPGLHLKKERVLSTAEKYNEDETEQLENYVQLFNGLFFEMDSLYILLLQRYEKNSEWEKCLSLWTQMQEDNILPSSAFMSHLERVLKKCKREIPFASSSGFVNPNPSANEKLNSLSQKQKDYYYLPLIEACLKENNVSVAVENLMKWISDPKIILDVDALPAIRNIFLKLIEKNDFCTIYQIFSKFNNYQLKVIRPNLLLSTCCFETGKYKEYLTYLENLLDESAENSSIIKKMFHSEIAAKAMLDNSEIKEKLRTFALKAIDNDIATPIQTIWIHEFLQGSPEAEQIFEQHLKNSTFFNSNNAIHICKNRAALSKLPELAEKLADISNINHDMKVRGFKQCLSTILNSDEPNKYKLAYECLRHAVKSIGFGSINANLIRTIEENLPEDLNIQALKTEHEERTQEKAIG